MNYVFFHRPTEADSLCFRNDYRVPEAEEGRRLGLPYHPGLPEAWKTFHGGCFSPHWEAANQHFCRLVVEGIC